MLNLKMTELEKAKCVGDFCVSLAQKYFEHAGKSWTWALLNSDSNTGRIYGPAKVSTNMIDPCYGSGIDMALISFGIVQFQVALPPAYYDHNTFNIAEIKINLRHLPDDPQQLRKAVFQDIAKGFMEYQVTPLPDLYAKIMNHLSHGDWSHERQINYAYRKSRARYRKEYMNKMYLQSKINEITEKVNF